MNSFPNKETKNSAISPSISGDAHDRHRAGTLIALFIIGFGAFVNLYATQPILPRFRELFHSSELLVSLTVSAPVLAVALTAPIVGLLSDAIGRKRVIIAAMLGLTIPTILVATAANLGQIIVWRFLQGLFIPGIVAVTMAYISEESPEESVGSTMATYVTGTVVGGFAGRFFVGTTATYWGWRPAFVFLGAVTLASALAAWRILPRSTKFVRQRNIAAALKSMRMHLSNPKLLATYAVGFNVLFCLVGTFTYVNFYLADEPFFLGPAALASIFAVYLIGAVITPIAGRIQDRIGNRKTLIGAVGLSATGMLLSLIPSVPVIIAGLACMASGVFVCQSASSSHVGKVADEARSSAAGLYVSLYYLGGSVGSVLPGLFWKQTGWSGCVAIIICMQIAAILLANKFWQD
jgi:YNFM family putative membrane transporter